MVNVARVEPLGFVEICFGLIPLAPPTGDIGQRFRNLAVIWQEPVCLLKVTHRRVVIFQAGIIVVALGEYRFAQVGLKCDRGFSGLPYLFT